MSQYPSPSYAAAIWVAQDGKFAVSFPPLPGREKGHTVLIPCSEDGMKMLRSILNQRSEHYVDGTALIGTKASPTQYNIAEMIRAMKVKKIEPKKDGSNIVSIEEIGL